MSSTAYSRKKRPDLVRRTLLDEAARIAVEHGLSGVTVQAVADAAGVTKGGLFHHFPSKQALIEAMFSDVLDQLGAEIEGHVAKDEQPHGRFTRAYVEVLLVGERFGVGSPFDALSVAAMAEPALRPFWTNWLDDRLARHRDTDSDPALEIVRFAADGAWMTYLGHRRTCPAVRTLRDRLIELTRGTGKPG